MSLQVWLPLDGRLDNLGCANSTCSVFTGEPVIDTTNSMLGSAYRYPATSSHLIDPTFIQSFTTKCSISFWLYLNSWESNYLTIFLIGRTDLSWEGYIIGMLRDSSSLSTFDFPFGTGNASTQSSILTSNWTLNTWYHVVIIYDNTNVKIYRNNELIKTATSTRVVDFTKVRRITIGSSTLPGYPTNATIQDFRIYDEALTAKLVDEIYRCLWLHFPMDVGTNLLSLICDTAGITTTGFRPNQLATLTNSTFPDGLRAIKVAWNQTTSTPGIKTTNTIDLKTNTTYVWSLDILSFGNCLILPTVWRGSAAIKAHDDGYVQRVNKTRVNVEFTTSSNNNTGITFFIFTSSPPSGSYIITGNWQLYEGTLDTLGLNYCAKTKTNNNICYDTSGYSHNGTYFSDPHAYDISPRYTHSTFFDNTFYILMPTYSSLKFTICFWANPKAVSKRGFIYTNWNGISIEMTASNTMFFKTTTLSSGEVYNTVPSTITVCGEWHHYCFVCDATTNRKLYIDGELVVTTDCISPITWSNNYNCLGNFSGTKYQGYLSDFRIYNNLLTAELVLDLYNTSMSVDSSGNISARILS